MLHLTILWIILIILFILWDTKKPKQFPPGPIWLPLIGSAIQVQKARKETGMLCKGIAKIASEYTNKCGLVGFKIGKDRIVMAVKGNALREMMLNEDLDGRPKGIFYETRTWNLRRGILFTDEELWQEQRRFVVRHLKEFGFARKGMVDIIQNEAEHLFEDFQEMVNNPLQHALVNMEDVFSIYVLNTLWVMLAGIRNSKENENVKRLQKLLSDLIASVDMVGAMFSHFPFLRFIAPEASGYKQFLRTHVHMYAFLRQEVENHRKNFCMENEPRDLMDVYLRVMCSSKEASSFTEQQLLAVCLGEL